ncbi:ThiF family adenylyltransferase [Acidipropionibacterium acidipropionici]|uniref:ThiF family adenylyltransferase n=1 Tax=Acidipropionibacterium acidipropionici TaxID=1748 RepID=UPI00110BA0C8|nr:ThiF family adenylyltransferase [Acidipropionibacterium acidipropionici]QCV96506.1 hypothetical protein FEZ30_15730 [Acidipropionibacterium acidipropionici]
MTTTPAPAGSLPAVLFTDSLIAEITDKLTTRAPERGAVILDFKGLNHVMIEDDVADYTESSWLISHEASLAAGTAEDAGLGTTSGTVHSHPDGCPDPSGKDVITMTHALEANPHLDSVIIAITTRGVPRPTDLSLGPDHRMSVHELVRTTGAPAFQRAQAVVVPLAADLGAVGLRAGAHLTVSAVLDGRIEGPGRIVAAPGGPRLRVSAGQQALLIGPGYPDEAPLIAPIADQPLISVPIAWQPGAGPDQRAELLAAALTGAESGQDPDGMPGPEGRYSRIVALTGSLNEAVVLVAGAGSVGSRIAEDLVRSGVEHLILLDPDRVAEANLARSVYTTGDIGALKVDALAARLAAVNPEAVIATRPAALDQVDPDELLDGIDLVVLATDDMAQQAVLAAAAYRLGIPQIGVGIYRRGAAGEVALIVPPATPCWGCVVGSSRVSAAGRPDRNYGVSNRLVSETALGPAINLVASAGSQAAIGLLAGPGSPAGAPLARLIAEHRVLGLITTTPDWSFFPQILGRARHQHAPQSLWPLIEATDDCPVCGAGPAPDDILVPDIAVAARTD